jgi:hypothetical protein
MPTATVHDSHLVYGGVCYFRGHASAVRLGSYGRKKKPLFGMNFLEVDGNLELGMSLRPAVVVDLDTQRSTKGHAAAGVTVVGAPVSADADATWEGFQSRKLKLVQFCLTLGAVRDAVRADGPARDCLLDNKRTGRVAFEVWVVMEASEAARFTAGGAVNAGVTAAPASVDPDRGCAVDRAV